MKSVKEFISGPAFRLLGYRPQRVSVDAWDREYRDGDWKYLESIGSIAGQASILGYVQFLKPDTVLDVGCGAGVLAGKLKVLPFKSLLGVDISAEAIAQANAAFADGRTSFAVSDADGFETDRTFDMIIFNQCMYYLPDPRATLRHYMRFLKPNGRVLVSMCDSARTRAMWPLLEREMAVEDAMTFAQSEGRGTTKVFKP
ncbi:MAG: methyltransferase domain-containing protein [Alphaproteobacteria bacterium]|nr:methyltransferase domain-containing protein [Alphaproteobacteria bacterium]MBL6939394.1 methyltransferase domain-containing protein [Alphaproteobacteria bacterium]MBL7097125.1 methyltransferase domain-containing protein [Alphaproteobacteria bacterium]